jgi:hypothetical protein
MVTICKILSFIHSSLLYYVLHKFRLFKKHLSGTIYLIVWIWLYCNIDMKWNATETDLILDQNIVQCRFPGYKYSFNATNVFDPFRVQVS